MRGCTWCHIDLMWCSKKDSHARAHSRMAIKYFLLWSHTVREIRFLFYDYNERMKGERRGGREERGEGGKASPNHFFFLFCLFTNLTCSGLIHVLVSLHERYI